MNGWTTENGELRTEIIKAINCDILAISETHLQVESDLVIEGSRWIGSNRNNIHVNAPKASGGVGFFL